MADPRRRLSYALLGMAVVLSLFAGRLVQIQGLDASVYAEAATSNRIMTVPLPSSRGSIVDASGVPLASTVGGVDVVVDQTLMENPVGAAVQLHEILDMDAAKLQRKFTGDDPYVGIKRRVAPEVWEQIRILQIPGIYAEDSSKRHYPAGAVAGSLVGFVGGDDYRGLSGIEQGFDEVLAGQDGSYTYERDDRGQAIPLGSHARTEPVAGRGLVLTVDRDLQWFAENALSAKVKEMGAASGSAVVVDTTTGDVLAMATSPTLDPRQPGKTPKADRGNRAVEESYEPGSVHKPLTIAAALDSGAVEPDQVFTVPPELHRDGKTIGNWDDHPTYQLTLAGILARSSNTGTVLVSDEVPSEVMRDYLLRFGYGSEIGIGLPGETPGLVPENWQSYTRDRIAFGQGVSTTILHLASAYATIANDGVKLPLRVIDAVVDADGTRHPVPANEPQRVISAQTAQQVTTMLEAVMQPDGTATHIQIPGYRIAGKTGTAEKADPECGCYPPGLRTLSFAGFAPADDPRFAVVVSIQEPSGGGGGTVAGPVFEEIMAFALDQRGVDPSATEPVEVDLYGPRSR